MDKDLKKIVQTVFWAFITFVLLAGLVAVAVISVLASKISSGGS
jgi:hypothetical protein